MRFPFELPAWWTGGVTEGGGGGGGETPEPPAPDAPSEIESTEPYSYELRRGSLWLGPLPGAFGGSRVRGLNTWETLEFSVLAEHHQAETLRAGCEVWVWRGSVQVGRYWVVRVETGAGAERVLRVTAASALWRLGQEGIALYSARTLVEPEEGEPYYLPVTVRAALTGLLALQTQSPAVTLGNISGAVGNVPVNLRLMGKSLLEWLQELRKIAGGFFEVDLENRLHWRTVPSALRGASNGLWLRDGKALLGLRHTVDFGDYANRIVAIGAGGWYENSLAVTVNNGAAQAALGRVVTAVVVDRAIKDTPTLTRWAGRVLAERSRARVGLEAAVVDLGGLHTGMLSSTAAAFEAGSRVALLHEGSVAVTGEAWVVEARHNLDLPSEVTVVLGDPAAADQATEDATAETLVDAVAALAARLKALEGEVDGELEEETARLREALDALRDTVDGLWEELPERWSDYLDAEVVGEDPPGGTLADALDRWWNSAREATPKEVMGRIEDLEGGSAAPEAGDEVLPVVSGESVDGTAETWARSDHQHQGVPIQTSGDPPASGECLLFSGGKLYMAVTEGESRVWLLISHLEAEEE